MRPWIFIITGSPCLRSCPRPRLKSMIRWTKKGRKKNSKGPKPKKNSSKPWSLKKEASTSPSVTALSSNTSIPSITSAAPSTALLLESAPSKSDLENNSPKKMSSNSCPTELTKSKEMKSVSTLLSEFIIVRLNVTYPTVFRTFLLIKSSLTEMISTLIWWTILLNTPPLRIRITSVMPTTKKDTKNKIKKRPHPVP